LNARNVDKPQLPIAPGRRLVAIDLKIGEVQPEFFGKMQFYPTALDRDQQRVQCGFLFSVQASF